MLSEAILMRHIITTWLGGPRFGGGGGGRGHSARCRAHLGSLPSCSSLAAAVAEDSAHKDARDGDGGGDSSRLPAEERFTPLLGGAALSALGSAPAAASSSHDGAVGGPDAAAADAAASGGAVFAPFDGRGGAGAESATSMASSRVEGHRDLTGGADRGGGGGPDATNDDDTTIVSCDDAKPSPPSKLTSRSEKCGVDVNDDGGAEKSGGDTESATLLCGGAAEPSTSTSHGGRAAALLRMPDDLPCSGNVIAIRMSDDIPLPPQRLSVHSIDRLFAAHRQPKTLTSRSHSTRADDDDHLPTPLNRHLKRALPSPNSHSSHLRPAHASKHIAQHARIAPMRDTCACVFAVVMSHPVPLTR